MTLSLMVFNPSGDRPVFGIVDAGDYKDQSAESVTNASGLSAAVRWHLATSQANQKTTTKQAPIIAVPQKNSVQPTNDAAIPAEDDKNMRDIELKEEIMANCVATKLLLHRLERYI
jgi:hypothetical protein